MERNFRTFSGVPQGVGDPYRGKPIAKAVSVQSPDPPSQSPVFSLRLEQFSARINLDNRNIYARPSDGVEQAAHVWVKKRSQSNHHRRALGSADDGAFHRIPDNLSWHHSKQLLQKSSPVQFARPRPHPSAQAIECHQAETVTVTCMALQQSGGQPDRPVHEDPKLRPRLDLCIHQQQDVAVALRMTFIDPETFCP
jgi:hypothetical protein